MHTDSSSSSGSGIRATILKIHYTQLEESYPKVCVLRRVWRQQYVALLR